MKKIVSFLMCAVALTGFVSCEKRDKNPDENTESVVESDTSASVYPDEPMNYQLDEFDNALIEYICLNGYSSSDFLISPSAFRASLCIASAGAQGNTRTELLKAAGFSGMDSLDKWYSSLNGSAAVSVWSIKDMLGEFSDSYVSNVTENYNAAAYSISSDELTQAIKDWTSQKTHGMLLNEADNLSGVSSLLISVLDLQSAWENAFSEANINEGVFAGNDGSKQMEFMEQTGEYLYAEEDGVKVIAIPMENDLSFVCFSGNRTDRFEKMKGIQPENVRVVLPKFELESVFDSRDLFGFILQQGVNDAVSSRTANFYNMCSDADWFMQEAVQKVRFSVNENGVSAPPEINSADGEAKEFIADSPFSFAIFSDFGTERQHMLLYGQMMNGD